MQSGTLTVTGEGKTAILLSGRPREVVVHFVKEPEPIPCNPHHHDHLEYKIEHEEESLEEHHKIGHHHHDRQFLLVIHWEVESVREIFWLVFY